MILFFLDAFAYSNSEFGAGSGTVVLDNVACNGGEYSLTECSSSGLGVVTTEACFNGSMDAGVVCMEGTLLCWYTCIN